MNREKISEISIDFLADIAGGILVAAGVYNFATTAEFPISGVTGVALILYQLFGLPIGTFTVLLNIPIILCTVRILGKQFFLKSFKSLIITSVIMDAIAPLFPVYTGDRLLAALCCGVLSGIGYALIFMRDSSTGGADFVAAAVRSKYPHFSIGKIIFVLDVLVIFLGTAIVSRNMESLIYGIVIAWLTTTVMDKMMYGTHQGKVTLIVTDHGPEICHAIDEKFDRGATILKGTGSYTRSNKDVVMCACNKKQMYGIRKLIKQVDPASFLVIMDSSDVVGEGFQKE